MDASPTSRSRFSSLLPAALFLATLCSFAVFGQPMAPEADRVEGGNDSADCADGVVLDDGSAETGYGWVPSVIEGEYVQEFDAADFSSRRLQSVCVCWLRTLTDSTIDFEVVFYRQVFHPEDGEPMPAPEPYAVVQGNAEITPVGITETFAEVGTSNVVIPQGRSYIGARWDASQDVFFFICTDTSDATDPVEVFFRDDRSEEGEWTSVFDTVDPIFSEHRALMVRALPGPMVTVDVPALGTAGLALLATVLAAVAIGVLRRSLSR